MKRNCFALLCGLLLVLSTGCAGCDTGTEEKTFVNDNSVAIMTWNVQSLFDGIDDGTEYEDFRESAGWSGEKYRGRLNVIGAAIGGMGRKPDIIALQEVESAQVLADLASVLAYGQTYFANIPGMALGVGLVSRLPFDSVKSHLVYINGDIAPRPMLEARINVSADNNKSQIVLFVCHWKSKLGSEDVTEAARRASARILLRRIRELAESEPELPVIVMGDLNENHDEFYRRSGTVVSAILPDDPRAAEFTGLYGFVSDDGEAIIGQQQDFIIISKNKPPAARYFPGGVTVLYSPWAADLDDGSYYYKNSWETIDHFLLAPQLFSGTGWDFVSCQVVNYPPFASVKGLPVAYNPRTGAGLSDHLPLLLFLKWQGCE